jgi:hypothetical protein
MECTATSRDLVRRRRICVRTHRRRSERGDDGIVLAPVEESPTGSKFTISLFPRRAARRLLTSNTEGDLGQAVTNAMTAAADAPRCTLQHGARSGWCVDAPEERKSRENIDGRCAQPLWRTSNERGRRSVILHVPDINVPAAHRRLAAGLSHGSRLGSPGSLRVPPLCVATGTGMPS